MEPSNLYLSRYPGTLKLWDYPWFAKRVVETLSCLHDIKMNTDEPIISLKSQELINLLLAKYPNLVAQQENLFSKNSDG